MDKTENDFYDTQWDPERLDGMDAIRMAMDPLMSKSTFYRRHRKEIDYILIERENWWRRRPRAPRYFTFRRLLMAHMLKRVRI
jgi:hypothetical protein